MWLTGWMLCVLIITLYPFDFGLIEKETRFTFLGRTPTLANTTDVVLNLLLFVPIGALLSHLRQQRGAALPVIARAGVVGLLISVLVECLQVYLPFRDSSITDILSNAAGAIVGALAHQRLGQRIARIRRTTSPSALAAAALVATVAALAVSAASQLHSGLSNWSLEYPLLIGNEDTGDRPWRGRVFRFEITDGATPRAMVRRFAQGSPVEPAGTRIAAVDLTGSAPYLDAIGHLPPLQLTTSVRGGRVVHAGPHPWLRTSGPASDLAGRIRETNAFTLFVRCATDAVDQSGPARIISNSTSPVLRNFTLGQRERDLVVRVRTPMTGENGANPEAVVRNVFTHTQPQEILVTYDGATLLIAVARSTRVYRIELGPRLPRWDVREETRAENLMTQRIVYLAVLFVIPGALFGIPQTTARRVSVGAAWLLVFTVLLETTLMVSSGREFHWSNLGVTSLVGAAVLTLTGGTVATLLSGAKDPQNGADDRAAVAPDGCDGSLSRTL